MCVRRIKRKVEGVTMEDEEQEAALVIQNVYKRYHTDSVVLNGLSMTVPQAAM